MAQAPKNKALALPNETTYAVVELGPKVFLNANGEPDAAFISTDAEIAFNGNLSGTIGTRITYPVGSSKAQVQTAVRTVVNLWLGQTEPGNTLNNNRIILGGLSD